MKLLFSVKDKVAGTFIPPFHYPTPRDAKDAFKFAVNDEKSHYNAHPKDYALVQLGSYDPETGILQPLDAPKEIISAHNLITQKKAKK